MGVFHVFKIVQMALNRAKRLISNTFTIDLSTKKLSGKRTICYSRISVSFEGIRRNFKIKTFTKVNTQSSLNIRKRKGLPRLT